MENSARSERKIVLCYAGQNKRMKIPTVLAGWLKREGRRWRGERLYIYKAMRHVTVSLLLDTFFH